MSSRRWILYVPMTTVQPDGNRYLWSDASCTSSLSLRAIMGTGGYMRNDSRMTRSRYFISMQSAKVQSRVDAPNMVCSSAMTLVWTCWWMASRQRTKLEPAAVVSWP